MQTGPVSHGQGQPGSDAAVPDSLEMAGDRGPHLLLQPNPQQDGPALGRGHLGWDLYPIEAPTAELHWRQRNLGDLQDMVRPAS